VTANGAGQRPFFPEEVRQRQVRLAERLAEHGLAGVVASSYPALYYLSGVPIHQFGRPAATVLTATGETVLITSVIEQGHVEVQATVDRVCYYYDLGVEATSDHPESPADSLTRLLSQEITALGLGTDQVGFEEASLPVEMLGRWQAASPTVAFRPVSRILAEQRSVLSPAELALVRAADSVADSGQAALLEALAAGATAREADMLARTRMLDALGADRPATPFALRIGTGLGDATRGAGHSEWTLWSGDERPRPGEVVVTGTDVLLWGYAGNVERTVAVEPVTDRVLGDFRTMVEACRAGTAAVRVGNTLGDVDRACKAVLTAAGYETRSGSGLGRGIVSWEGNARDPLMDVRLYSDLPIQAGMAISVEPDLLTADGTYRHCNTVIATDSGPVVDSRLDWDLIVIDPYSSQRRVP
jgi:Xaa-Pro aminopeptidase